MTGGRKYKETNYITSKRMGLIVNENKRKNMIMIRHLRVMQNITIGHYTFEQVENFKYLEVNLTLTRMICTTK